MNKTVWLIGGIAVALGAAWLISSPDSESSADGERSIVVPPIPRLPADSTAGVSSTAEIPADTGGSAAAVGTPPATAGAGASIPLATTPANPPRVVPVPPTPSEPQDDAMTVLRRTSAAYSSVRSMRADFTQSVDNPLLGRKTVMRGTVSQRRPDRFLMRYSEPAGDVIVSDGEYFWMYTPSVDAKQVFRAKASETGGLDLQSQFIGDPTRRFTWTDHGSETVAGRPTRVITLVPRTDAGYKTLKVWIDMRDHLVRRFELGFDTGVVQHYDLSNLETNVELADALFRFTPPPGARVVDR